MKEMKGAIFDMDGVLFDTEALYQKSWREIAKERGIELDDSYTKAISGTSGKAMQETIMRYYRVDDAETALEIELDCKRRVKESLKKHVPMKIGVSEILKYLHENEFRIAIASSSDREQIKHNIQKAGIEEYFNAIVSGAEVKKGKPAPDIFLAAARQLDLDPETCFVFEDSENGVRSGHAAGCFTVMIPDMVQPSKETKSLCDFISQDLLEVVQKLSSI